jgi:molybdopterin/thiamine biosynthesis adenylyltransferase/rhodanese-related sulfurtransferase
MSTEPASAIPEIDPVEAARMHAAGALLLDVREPGEWALGSPEGALRIALAALPLAIDRAPLQDHRQEIAVLCASGRRSLLAAAQLRAAGFARVASVAGGFQRWQQLGLPWSVVSTLDEQSRERYSRHLLLPEVGEAGQQRLLRARVLLVGAGGLGSPAALYLAAAGVGYLRIMDPDVVERSNLQRQILHVDARVGESKAESAAGSLRALNPSVVVDARAQRVDAHNVRELVGDVDLVVDGSDNFEARYLLDAACSAAGKPLVYGAIHRFEGQVSVFGGAPEAPCYRCLFPDPPAAQDAPNCAEAGVLGVLPGIIGTLQATEALKLLLGIGRSLRGRLLHVDALTMQFRELRIVSDPRCPGCGPAADRRPPQGLEATCWMP